jgi:two-component system chemotaxis sensor kinase CheA
VNVDDELIGAFLEESEENLNQLDLDLVTLEANPNDPELLGRIFRTMHTIKGTCGFLAFSNLEALAHAGEDVLAALRDDRIALDGPLTTTLLRLVDDVRGVLATVAATGTEGNAEHTQMISELRGHLSKPEARSAQHQTETAGDRPPEKPTAPSGSHPGWEDTTLKVDLAVLDGLQELVGELTLARMRLGDHIDDDSPLSGAFRRLTVISRDLQDTVMRARLQPISTATDRLRRIVRDIAAAESKAVRIVVEGGDVTVDKAIIEVLRDPLVHLVRNAVDHGIELPAERVQAGKDPEATVSIRATLAGGGAQVEVSDDGRGVSVPDVVNRAVALGQVTATEASEMSESERIGLLFSAGVSTAAAVTTVSGRGVGMDAVRTAIEQVGGGVTVHSETGVGTTFRINVPLKLAILPAIAVDCRGVRLTVPQTDVVAIVRVPEEDPDRRLTSIGSARFLRYHGTLLPLVDLAAELELVSAPTASAVTEIVVVSKLDRTYGLIVDGVGDDFDAVVKPLPRPLQGVAHYAGTTVLASGRPSLILETSAFAIAAARSAPTPPTPADVSVGQADSELLLTVEVADEHFALPAARIRRLAHITRDRVERSGGADVLQYHDSVLTVVHLRQALGRPVSPGTGGDLAADDFLALVICRGDTHPDFAVSVDRIGDIHFTAALQPATAHSAPVAQQVLVADAVTQVLDVDWLATRAAAGRDA